MNQEENVETKSGIRGIMVIIIIIGLTLLIIGLVYEIPSREFYFSDLKKYVGGDAYNAIIEGSLRGGEISGAIISKAIYICSGIITMSIGFLGIWKKNND